MGSVKQMYQTGAIRRVDQAEGMLKLLQNNQMKEFKKRFDKVEIAQNTKVAAQQAKEVIKHTSVDVNPKPVEKESTKHIYRVKNKSTELPTFELEFKKEYTVFNAAWHDGVERLVKMARDRLQEKKRNIKLVVGVEVIISKPSDGDHEPKEMTIHAHTMPESVFNDNDVAKYANTNRTSSRFGVVCETNKRVIHHNLYPNTVKRFIPYTNTTCFEQF